MILRSARIAWMHAECLDIEQVVDGFDCGVDED